MLPFLLMYESPPPFHQFFREFITCVTLVSERVNAMCTARSARLASLRSTTTATCFVEAGGKTQVRDERQARAQASAQKQSEAGLAGYNFLVLLLLLLLLPQLLLPPPLRRCLSPPAFAPCPPPLPRCSLGAPTTPEQ